MRVRVILIFLPLVVVNISFGKQLFFSHVFKSNKLQFVCFLGIRLFPQARPPNRNIDSTLPIMSIVAALNVRVIFVLH